MADERCAARGMSNSGGRHAIAAERSIRVRIVIDASRGDESRRTVPDDIGADSTVIVKTCVATSVGATTLPPKVVGVFSCPRSTCLCTTCVLDCLPVFHRDGEPVIDWRKARDAACKTAGFPGKGLHNMPAGGGS